MLLNARWPQRILALPWGIILLIVAIGGFGLVVLYSAAGGSMRPWASAQGTRFAVLLLAMLMLSQVDARLWLRFAYPIYAIVLAALVGVEALGAISGGSQRWLDLGFIRLQPSEFMKLAIILALARFYHYLPRGYVGRLAGMWPPLAMIAVPAALVMLQPDLGTALMIVAGGLSVMFLGGLPLRWIFGPGAALVAALPVVFNLLHDYQKRRVLIFLDPESDPLGSGYHITQSKIAIGSGGLTGKGFLQGTQSHLEYLPEQHTDFVFATMAEEWGLVGGALLLLAFGIVLNWGLRVAMRAETMFVRLVAGGLSMTLFFYVLINVAMVMGLAPVVGIPLPLVSWGGSAMMTVLILMGILLGMNRQKREPLE
ncbi:rod shape-determining protein RodA [Sandaracinobacteroides saxicola]|uniref:Peptidoglycan glycosyltransferase MrdB n=1 Tax=Sandaracinobacteroides saxicola TaxID=2759707 RepID=A0A7G5IGF2_9SPHN|nr:rod shape-determining protein RodA [Sandaracinobacteroides saxicola]QMW22444.1 rod shape-determining protein RodA [Sandaracinobacteroides saxicola]